MRESTLKWVAIVSVVFAAFTYFSADAAYRDMKTRNGHLIDTNIQLQKALGPSGRQPAAVAVVPNTGAKASTTVEKSLQHLEHEGLVIDVQRRSDKESSYCTKIDYQGETLLDECYAQQPRYSVPAGVRFGAPVFREEWQLDRDTPNDTSSGVTFWTVDDGELLQALRLPTSRTLPFCHDSDGTTPCAPQRWLKASLQLRDGTPPTLAWRYLTEVGESAEVVYRWEMNRFVMAENPVVATTLKRYGF